MVMKPNEEPQRLKRQLQKNTADMSSDNIDSGSGLRYSETAESEMIHLCQKALKLDRPPRVERVMEGGEKMVWFVENDYVAKLDFEGQDEWEAQLREVIRSYYGKALRIVDNRSALEGEASSAKHGMSSGKQDVKIHHGRERVLELNVKEVDPIPISFSRMEESSEQTTDERDWSFTMEYRIHGTSVESFTPNDRTEAGLVLLLTVLKSIPLEDDADSIIRRLSVEDDLNISEDVCLAMEAWKRLERNGQLQLQDRDDVTESISYHLNLPDLETSKAMEATFSEEKRAHVLLHRDLKGEHILVDPSTGSVAGILDWSDAAIGDVAIDIAGLSISVGAAMASRVATKAGYDHDTVFRGIVQARCDAVTRLDHRLNGLEDGESPSPIDLLRRQLKRSLEEKEGISF